MTHRHSEIRTDRVVENCISFDSLDNSILMSFWFIINKDKHLFIHYCKQTEEFFECVCVLFMCVCLCIVCTFFYWRCVYLNVYCVCVSVHFVHQVLYDMRRGKKKIMTTNWFMRFLHSISCVFKCVWDWVCVCVYICATIIYWKVYIMMIGIKPLYILFALFQHDNQIDTYV